MTNATQEPKTGDKKPRVMRSKAYIVQKLSTALKAKANAEETIKFESWDQVAECLSFAGCDKWINDNGEDGSIYRGAIITKPVKVETETEIKRKITPVE